MISLFTPSFADESDTNAQNLTVKEIVARLRPDKFQVTMLHEGSADPRIASRANTKLIRCTSQGTTRRVLWHLLKSIPDLYFFPRYGPLDVAFLILRKQFRLKTALITYIVSGGLYNPGPPPDGMLRNAREADLVFANARYLSELVQERLGMAAEVRYDGIDCRYYFSADTKDQIENSLTVLFVGSLRAYKRGELMIKEAARWPDVKFRIVGKGEEGQRIRAMTRDLNCSNVTFVDHLSPRGVGEEMRRADIFFHPSVIEGHPQVLGQAAACGLPAVAMNIYRPEYVIDEQTGFLAESDEELSAGLGRLIQEANLRRSMGHAAAIHSQKYNWDEITLQWEEAFERAVRQRQRK